MSENEFYVLNGNRYRGSRYANFVGAGVDPQGNVSTATNESAANQLGTSVDGSAQTSAPAPGTALQTNQVSQGLLSSPESPEKFPQAPSLGTAAKDLIIGSAVPYAGKTIGQAAGAAISGGATAGQALKTGVQSLGSKVTGNVSAGLVGNLAGSNLGAATNAALSGLGGKFGPATASQVAGAASKGAGSAGGSFGGSAIGGGIGAGIGTAAATLLTGGSVKDAVKSGAGSAAGTIIGTAVGGPIGGFIGGTIGSFFCFAPDTPILMADGSQKPVSELRLGDIVLYGGKVTVRGEAYSDGIYNYKNTVVSGSHAVFEDGKWIRVMDSEYAQAADQEVTIVTCPVDTEAHILVTPWFVAADLSEIEAETWEANPHERLSVLNSDDNKNKELIEIERKFCVEQPAREAA